MPKIKLVLADDHAVVRKGFRLILSQEPDFEVIGEAGGGDEVVRMATEAHPEPDVVITCLS